MQQGSWRHQYARPAGAEAIGTAGVLLLRGNRVEQRDRRQRAYAEQAERLRRTGFAGGNAELGHAVAFELRRLGKSAAVAAFGGHLSSVAGSYNFQGNPRLAKLVGRSLRSIQRYRAELEADGLLRSYCLEPGDMIDGQRAPVSRPQIVRDVSPLRALAAPALSKPRPRPHRRTRGQRLSGERAAATVAPRPEPAPVTPEQLAELAQRPGVASWVTEAILGRGGAAASGKRPQERPAPPPPPTDAELDALDAELRELTEQRERERERPPDPPPN